MAERETGPTWELVTEGVNRLEIKGGWLYKVDDGTLWQIVFVPSAYFTPSEAKSSTLMGPGVAPGPVL